MRGKGGKRYDVNCWKNPQMQGESSQQRVGHAQCMCQRETYLATSYEMVTPSCQKSSHCTPFQYRANVVTQARVSIELHGSRYPGSRKDFALHRSNGRHSILPMQLHRGCTHHQIPRCTVKRDLRSSTQQRQVSYCLPEKQRRLRKEPRHCLRQRSDCARRLQHDRPIVPKQDWHT